MNIIDRANVEIEISGIEIVALKKLSLVSHALASKLTGGAGREQTCLASVLDDVIRRVELSLAARPKQEDVG